MSMIISQSDWYVYMSVNRILIRPREKSTEVEIDQKMAFWHVIMRIILGMGSANERRRYIVTSFLIGWAHTQNDPCIMCSLDLTTDTFEYL